MKITIEQQDNFLMITVDGMRKMIMTILYIYIQYRCIAYKMNFLIEDEGDEWPATEPDENDDIEDQETASDNDDYPRPQEPDICGGVIILDDCCPDFPFILLDINDIFE